MQCSSNHCDHTTIAALSGSVIAVGIQTTRPITANSRMLGVSLVRRMSRGKKGQAVQTVCDQVGKECGSEAT